MTERPTASWTLDTAEVLFTPADFDTLPARDLSRTTCVVFDILRATTSMVTALANGAEAVVPVAEISEAVAWRARRADALLAGERHGLRISAELSGGVDFDFGNSPREFTPEKVRGRLIVTTTTNGTRALRACAGAATTLVGAFANLSAMADELSRSLPRNLVLVCSGTFEQTGYEDVLAAGALIEAIETRCEIARPADGVLMARELWALAKSDPLRAVSRARNARKLRSVPELAADVEFSMRRDTVTLVTTLRDGVVRGA